MPDLRALGASLIVISPQTQAHSRTLKESSKLNFDLLFDAGCQVAEAYGLAAKLPDDLIEIYKAMKIDLVAYDGDDSWRLPIPGRLVLDRDGLVRHIDSDPDYTRRPEPAETVAFVRTLV